MWNESLVISHYTFHIKKTATVRGVFFCDAALIFRGFAYTSRTFNEFVTCFYFENRVAEIIFYRGMCQCLGWL